MTRTPYVALRMVAVALLPWGLASCDPVTPADEIVTRLEVSPVDLTLAAGRDSLVGARVFTEAGATLINEQVFWSTADPNVATVDTRGRVTAVAPGPTRIAASRGGKSALVQVRVVAPPVAVVRVSPTTSGITVGDNLTLRAAALLASGDTVVGRPVTWRSNNAAVATVSTTGTVQGTAAGTATIFATVDGISGSATVAVQAVPVATVTVAPTATSLFVGRTQQVTATTRAADSTLLTGRSVAWSSSAPTVASVSTAGLVTALTIGGATITATSEGQRATAQVRVIPVPVRTVNVVPATVTVLTGSTARLLVVTLDSTGAALTGRVVKWTSAPLAIARVDSSGLVAGVVEGNATITATSEGRSGTAVVTVIRPPVARVTIAPAAVTLARGLSLQLVAATFGADGSVLTGRVVTWLSGSPSLARVDANGVVTALATGTVLLFATSEGQRGTATVVVP